MNRTLKNCIKILFLFNANGNCLINILISDFNLSKLGSVLLIAFKLRKVTKHYSVFSSFNKLRTLRTLIHSVIYMLQSQLITYWRNPEDIPLNLSKWKKVIKSRHILLQEKCIEFKSFSQMPLFFIKFSCIYLSLSIFHFCPFLFSTGLSIQILHRLKALLSVRLSQANALL